MATLNLSAPWVIFYRKVNAMFEKDYDIKVVYDDTDGSKPELKLYVNGAAKASALTELLPSEKNFGGVTLKISVIPANLNNSSYRSRRRKVYTIDSLDTDDIFHKAFTGNKAFIEAYSIEGVFDNPICYVIFAKEVFGGTGYNFLNIALVTRAFLFFAYPSKMSGDGVFVSLGDAATVDAYSGATPLGQIASSTDGGVQLLNVAGEPLTFWDTFIGLIPGSWGETSTLFILVGAAILLLTGIASWRIMTSAVVGGLVMSAVAHYFATPLYPATLIDPVQQLCLGGFAFAVVFMATDPVTACRTNVGKYIYGFMIGVMAIVIRCYNTGYPEGAMLAVLLMNCFAPLIDYCVVEANIRRRLARTKANV